MGLRRDAGCHAGRRPPNPGYGSPARQSSQHRAVVLPERVNLPQQADSRPRARRRGQPRRWFPLHTTDLGVQRAHLRRLVPGALSRLQRIARDPRADRIWRAGVPEPELTAQFAGTGWPPDWDRLAYHNFQYDQTFHVAGVAMGDSWEEFIRNSQIYQARLLKFSIEQYRKAKYEKLGGLFQFMFMDAWPAVTWSVVDSDRQPKPGYDALREAYQPVLIGCDRDREVVITGVDRGGHERPLVINPWIINDLHSDLTGCTCGVELSGPGGRFNWNAEQPIDIGADATLVHAPAITCDLPKQLAPGDYQLTLTLHHDNDFISRNRYDLSVGRIPTGT